MIKIIIAVVAVVFSILGKIAHSLLSSDSAIKRKLKSRSNSRILDIKDNTTIQVLAEASSSTTLMTPLLGEECIWFKLIIKTTNWEKPPILDDNKMIDFSIHDHTGNASVIAKNMIVVTPHKSKEFSSLSETQKERVLEFLKEKKVENSHLMVYHNDLIFEESWMPNHCKIKLRGKGYSDKANANSRTIKSDLIKPLFIEIIPF